MVEGNPKTDQNVRDAITEILYSPGTQNTEFVLSLKAFLLTDKQHR
jgi:hypothetical protein